MTHSMKEKPLIDKLYQLQKFPGKGGWTFAAIPEVVQNKNSSFGWVKVNGFIDGYELKNYNLAPMGNGQLFLPVKKEIRKQIKKEAGDWVHILLFAPSNDYSMPDEFMLCLQEEPMALQFFQSLDEQEKDKYIQWILAARTDELRVERIIQSIHRLSLKFPFASK